MIEFHKDERVRVRKGVPWDPGSEGKVTCMPPDRQSVWVRLTTGFNAGADRIYKPHQVEVISAVEQLGELGSKVG